MRDLAVRLAALDADASAAVQVIAYFDGLAEAGAGLQSIVRGAAVLAGCPARLDDTTRRLHIRMLPDGVAAPSPTPAAPALALVTPPSAPATPTASAADPIAPTVSAPGPVSPSASASDPATPTASAPGPATPDWPHQPLDDTATLWLERTTPPGPVDAMVLERAAAAARAVLSRTRGRAPATDTPALIELLIDATVPPESRLRAARLLGLEPPAYAQVTPTGEVTLHPAPAAPPPARTASATPPPARTMAAAPSADWTTPTNPASVRAGIGPAVPILDLPESFQAARIAARFSASGTDDDPGDLLVRHDELGSLAVLATVPDPGLVPDVRTLEQAAATTPWLPATLHAVTTTVSLRAAATLLRLHHSTLQDRVTQAEHLLGWSLHTPHGLLRARLALTLRHLHRTPS